MHRSVWKGNCPKYGHEKFVTARAWRCIWIKSDWHLSINPAEEAALRQMIGTCGGG